MGAKPAGSGMLEDLLNNPLDPGYRRAASQARSPRRWEKPVSWLGCLAIGFVLVLAYQQSHRSAPARAAARKDLIARIVSLQAAGDHTEASTKSLAEQVSALRDSQLSKTRIRVPLAEEVISGAVAVTGPGVRVMVGEPGGIAAGTGSPPTVGPRLRDSDIRAIVNTLWSVGAEAISVNGVRLTALSSIRVAGQSILVDFQPVSSPYSVEAIGDTNTLLVGFADSQLARALVTRKAVDGISFSSESERLVRLAAGTAPQVRHAQLGNGATP